MRVNIPIIYVYSRRIIVIKWLHCYYFYYDIPKLASRQEKKENKFLIWFIVGVIDIFLRDTKHNGSRKSEFLTLDGAILSSWLFSFFSCDQKCNVLQVNSLLHSKNQVFIWVFLWSLFRRFLNSYFKRKFRLKRKWENIR